MPCFPSRINSIYPTSGGLKMCALVIILATISSVLVMGGIALTPVALSPISWLLETKDAGALLGTLLAAQAAIAALTLAVSLFVMQGVKRDADDRVYREYVRRSWVRFVFWVSLTALAFTGAVFLTESFVGTFDTPSDDFPDLRNLALVAAMAFFVSLALAVVLFERTIRLGHPEQWHYIKRHVNEHDVRRAVEIFLCRWRRAAALEGDLSDIFSVGYPDPGEGSADEAIRALLDDALRAIDERRQSEFTRSLGSIMDLITYAMDQLASAGMCWSDPGHDPEWPPLRELDRNLYTFREEVIRRGDLDQVIELMSFDGWCIILGLQRGCGELFTVGLDGYRRNYQIAKRAGVREFLEVYRDRLWLDARSWILSVTPTCVPLIHPRNGESAGTVPE